MVQTIFDQDLGEIHVQIVPMDQSDELVDSSPLHEDSGITSIEIEVTILPFLYIKSKV